MMKLKDILTGRKGSHIIIEYRVFYEIQAPQVDQKNLIPNIFYYNGKYWQDTLFGKCEYDKEKDELISLDGDSYSLEANIIRWEWTALEELTVWEDPSEQIQNWDDYKAGYDDGIEKAKKMLLEHVNKEYIEYSRNRFLFDVNKIWEKIKNDIK